MPERNGYKTLDLIAQEIRVSERKVREAIEALKIEPTIFNLDKRFRYYSPDNISQIKEWILEN